MGLCFFGSFFFLTITEVNTVIPDSLQVSLGKQELGKGSFSSLLWLLSLRYFVPEMILEMLRAAWSFSVSPLRRPCAVLRGVKLLSGPNKTWANCAGQEGSFPCCCPLSWRGKDELCGENGKNGHERADVDSSFSAPLTSPACWRLPQCSYGVKRFGVCPAGSRR